MDLLLSHPAIETTSISTSPISVATRVEKTVFFIGCASRSVDIISLMLASPKFDDSICFSGTV